MYINIFVALLITILLYIAVPVIFLLVVDNRKIVFRVATTLIILFMIVLPIFTLGSVSFVGDSVFITIKASGEWCSKAINWGISLDNSIDVLINIFMLVPIGAYVVVWNDHYSYRYSIVKALILGLVVGLIIESLQYILPVSR